MKKLDIFGSQVSVRFQGSLIHQTKFGAFITLVLYLIISLRLSTLISNVLSGSNPTVLYQERQVDHPKNFAITPQSLGVALGLKDLSNKYYMDEKMFIMQGIHLVKKLVLNPQSGQYEAKFTTIPFNLEQCTQKHIPDDNLRSYFEKSQLDKHLCLPLDKQLEIEGEFNSDSYQEIRVLFKKCSGTNCYDAPTMDKLLNNHYVEVLFTDVYVSPEDKKNPFKQFSRDLYWTSSKNLPKNVNMFMRNNYVESDFGWFFPDIQTDIYPSFSYQDVQMCVIFNSPEIPKLRYNRVIKDGLVTIVDTSNDYFFKIVIRFEKQKENLYKRSYDKVFNIMSQIGGFSQILLTVFSFICLRYSSIHLNRSLLNESYNFQDTTNNVEQASMISNCTTHQQNQQTEINMQIDNWKNDKITQKQFLPIQKQDSPNLIPVKQDRQSIHQFQSASPIFQKDNTPKVTKTVQQHKYKIQKQQSGKTQQPDNSKQNGDEELIEFQKQQEIQLNKNQKLDFNVFSYFFSLCSSILSRFRLKKKIIDYGFKQLDNKLDIQYIVKKMIEIDKLKRIIFNDDQLLLFDYIPKPSILYRIQKDRTINFEKTTQFTKNQNLTEFEKFKMAKKSFKTIVEKKKQTKIDQSILNLLDESLYNSFKSQLFRNEQSFSQTSNGIKKMEEEMQEANQFNGIDFQEEFYVSTRLKNYSSSKHVRNPSFQPSMTYDLQNDKIVSSLQD